MFIAESLGGNGRPETGPHGGADRRRPPPHAPSGRGAGHARPALLFYHNSAARASGAAAAAGPRRAGPAAPAARLRDAMPRRVAPRARGRAAPPGRRAARAPDTRRGGRAGARAGATSRGARARGRRTRPGWRGHGRGPRAASARGVPGAHVEDARLVVARVAGHQAVPVVGAQQRPDGHGPDVGTPAPAQRAAPSAQTSASQRICSSRRAAQVRLGDGQRTPVALPGLAQQRPRPGDALRGARAPPRRRRRRGGRCRRASRAGSAPGARPGSARW